jgi:hypothetical protein
MPMKEFCPLAPKSGDCIVVIEGSSGQELFYCHQEGSVAVILDRYTKKYEALYQEKALKCAVYRLDSLVSTHLFGIELSS